MNENYGTDAERRLGAKDKRVGVRLSDPEYLRFRQVLEHQRIQPAVWFRQAVTHMVVEGRRPTTHEALAARLGTFRAEVKSFGSTGLLLVNRMQQPMFDAFMGLLGKLGPVVTFSMGARWALWTHGAEVLARPSKADYHAAYEQLQRRILDPANRVPETDVKLVTGYISPKDLT